LFQIPVRETDIPSVASSNKSAELVASFFDQSKTLIIWSYNQESQEAKEILQTKVDVSANMRAADIYFSDDET